MTDDMNRILFALDGVSRRLDELHASRPARLLTRKAAADSLSMSLDHLEKHVQPHLRLVRSGALRLVPADELDRWVRANQGFAE
jgi:hypothetical protein